MSHCWLFSDATPLQINAFVGSILMPMPFMHFLRSLDPRETLDAPARRVDEALNGLLPGVPAFRDHRQFFDMITTFCLHIEAALLQQRRLMTRGKPWVDFTRFQQILQKEFGRHPTQVAYSLAINGVEGGLLRVLRTIAQLILADYCEHDIAQRVGGYWDHLDYRQKLHAVVEYVRHFGYLVPPEIIDQGPENVLAYFPALLLKHPYALQQTRQAGDLGR